MIITVASTKGGVGKTSLVVFLAQALRGQGKNCLVSDLDQNNNTTDYCLRHLSEADYEALEASNVRQVLTGKRKASGVIWHAPFGDIIPATPTLATVGLELANNPMMLLGFSAQLRALDYDVVLVDTPPALGTELTAGLLSADLVLVPVSSARWAVLRYLTIRDEVEKVGLAGRAVPRILAVPSMTTEGEAEALREVPAWMATKAWIKRDPQVKAAATEGRALRPGTQAAEAFAALAGEVVG